MAPKARRAVQAPKGPKKKAPEGGKGRTGNRRGRGASGTVETQHAPPSKRQRIEFACPEADLDEDDPADCVVKVFVARSEPNYAVPWSNMQQDSKTGTAFAIAHGKKGKSRWLLTNAHVVHNASVVQVRRRGDHQKFIATVLCIGLDCDLALLTVEDPAFWDGLPVVAMEPDLPDLQDEVTVVGFPIGGDSTCVTVGVVSRIDMTDYASRGKVLLAIQIDAAINPGNSGGPCFSTPDDTGDIRCIGVAFQGLVRADAENIGYIIPAEVVEHFINDYSKNGKYTGFGNSGFSVQPLENARMRAALGLKTNQSGVLMRRIHPASPANKVLKQGDILMEVDTQVVGNDGKVAFSGARNARIDLGYIISKKFVGDNMAFAVMRNKKILKVQLKLSRLERLVVQDPPVPPPYFVIGGLVFVPLSEPLLHQEYGEHFDKEAPIGITYQWAEGLRKFDGHELVVLSQVLASPLTVGFTDLFNVILVKFNGVELKNLQHLISLLSAAKTEYLSFEFDHSTQVILPRKEVMAQSPKILADNMIPYDRSVQFRK